MPDSEDPLASAASEAAADAAASRGDFRSARALLDRATSSAPGQLSSWLKLAAMCRATGDLTAGLDAVRRGLALNPLDFLALLMQANLLDRLDDPGAGEAYGRALAQRPAGELAPAMATTLAQAQMRHDHHLAKRTAIVAAASASVRARATPAQQGRIDRFASNTLRKTRVYHAEPTSYHYPGLVEREFHDRDDFPWLATLEAATAAITSDFHRVVAAERAALVPYVQYADDIPAGQWQALNHSREWTAIHLLRKGERVEENAVHCPATMAVLAALPQPVIPDRTPNAMFSLLAPGAHIPPHHGVANTRLVCHLPLIVPDGCWFRVGADTRCWHPGTAWVFDDTIEHEAANDSQSLRVILIIDVWHPGLDPVERQAVAAVMAAGEGGGIDGL